MIGAEEERDAVVGVVIRDAEEAKRVVNDRIKNVEEGRKRGAKIMVYLSIQEPSEEEMIGLANAPDKVIEKVVQEAFQVVTSDESLVSLSQKPIAPLYGPKSRLCLNFPASIGAEAVANYLRFGFDSVRFDSITLIQFNSILSI